MNMSSRKPYLDKISPDTFKALLALSANVTSEAIAAGLTPEETELIKVRASQINACAYCLNVHTADARKIGVSEQKLDLLAAWREATIFSERERAIIAVAETATRTPLTAESHRELDAAQEVLGDEQFAYAQWLAVTINAFNRISILSEYPVRERK
ncbi:carboxymuconolactone decarboxylase family protein [Actinotignum urinale]|uniref:Carboxymuconolactone decarboxylase family protein n=2 Tax=Actinotignum urinale TaxID=190146 RepID=A0AAW9HQW5_9ACTO|nr:carboxymuconolactone decarboxylase family protein [Actinotignum urinale]MDY5132412.1 carboxymuconolactone decarboxylase family protein [Actinotignum urinale]MDY5155042.1 carboxymuconolactone decarboxylase family protein [Actinotignum urinale]